MAKQPTVPWIRGNLVRLASHIILAVFAACSCHVLPGITLDLSSHRPHRPPGLLKVDWPPARGSTSTRPWIPSAIGYFPRLPIKISARKECGSRPSLTWPIPIRRSSCWIRRASSPINSTAAPWILACSTRPVYCLPRWWVDLFFSQETSLQHRSTLISK